MSGLSQVCLAVFLLGFVGWSASFIDWKEIVKWLNHERDW